MSRCRSKFLVTVAVALLVAPFITPQAAFAQSSDSIKREVERIVDELDRLHAKADELAEDYNEALDRQRELDEEIVVKQAEVAATEAELDGLRGDLAAVAVRSFTGSGGDVLGPLFSNAQAYTDGLRSEQYSRAALDAGTGTTDDLDELIRELDKDRKELQDLLDENQRLQETIEQKQTQTEALTEQYTAARADAESRYAAALKAEEERRAAAAWAELQRQYAAAQAAASISSNSGGGGGGNAVPAGGATTGSGGGATSTGNSGSGKNPLPTPVTDIPAVSGRAGVAIQAAMGQQGVKYRYAASEPGVAFDCSGLTHYAWGQAGVYLPRNSRAQAASVPRIPAGAAQPGDLIFYYNPISHVGIYLGGGSYVHAPATGDVVKVSGVNWDKVTAVGRPG